MADATKTARKPNLAKLYRAKLPKVSPERVDVRVRVVRFDKSELDVGAAVESIDWTDGKEGLSGSVTFRRPVQLDPKSLPVTGGSQRLRVIVRWGDQWYTLFETRLDDPEVNLTGVLTATHGDDLAALDVGEREWLFRKDKAHPKGWFAHEIVIFAAGKLGVRLGKIAKGERRLGTVKLEGTLADLIEKVYKEEKTTGGRQFVVRMRNRRLDILEFERNKIVYEVGRDTATDISIKREYPKEPVTVLTGKAKVGKGKARKTVRFTVAQPGVIAKFGKKSSVKDYGKLPSRRSLQTRVMRDYAEGIRPKRSVEVSNAFMPFVRRGDAVYVDVPTEGFRGSRGFLFVEQATHAITGAEKTTSLVLTEEDAYGAYREKRDEEARSKKRAKRTARRASGAS